MRHRNLSASLLLLVLTTLACKTFGQNFNATGGRALGMAGTNILLADAFGLFNNPGAVEANSLTFVAAYHTQYIQLGLNDARLGLIIPTSLLTTGLGVEYFGDALLNEMLISSFMADEFGFAKVGVRVNYHQVYVQNYGYKNTVSIDIGGLFTLSKQVSLAMVFQNLNRAKLNGETDARLSSFLQLGLSYQPINKFRIDAQVEKSIEELIRFRLGFEYKVTKLVSLRSGFSPTNTLAALGMGLSWNTMILDIAANYQQQLGYSGVISLKVFKLRK